MRFLGKTVACAVVWSAALLAAAELPREPGKLTAAKAVDAYLAVVEDAGQTPMKRNYAAAQIVQLGKEAVPRITELYGDAGLDRRGDLARIVGSMGKAGAAAAETLLEDLRSSRLKVHPNVIKALGDLEAADATPLLLEVLPDATDETRLAIFYALGRLADERAADALVAGLDNTDRLVRATCANGIARLLIKLKPKDATAKPGKAYGAALGKVLDYIDHGQHADVRRILVNGTGTLGDARAARVLRRLLKVDSGAVQLAAAKALGTLKDNDAVEALTNALFSEDAALRRAALQALADIGDMRCVPVLIDRLGVTAPDERKDIVRTLTRVTGKTFSDNPDQWRQWWKSRQRPDGEAAG